MAKKFTNHEAIAKMDAAIWRNGKDRARITTILNEIKLTRVAQDPDVLKAIKVLEAEKMKLLQELQGL